MSSQQFIAMVSIKITNLYKIVFIISETLLNSKIGIHIFESILRDTHSCDHPEINELGWSLIKNIFQLELLEKCIDSIGQNTVDGNLMNDTHHLLFLALHQIIKSNNEILKNELQDSFFAVPSSIFIHLIKVYEKLVGSIPSAENSPDLMKTGSMTLSPAFCGNLDSQVFFTILRIFCESLLYMDIDTRLILSNNGLVRVLIATLYWADVIQPKSTLHNPIEDVAGLSFVKRDAVRSIASLCHGDGTTEIQNQVRILGGMGLILNQCVVDDHNPCK